MGERKNIDRVDNQGYRGVSKIPTPRLPQGGSSTAPVNIKPNTTRSEFPSPKNKK